MEFSRRKLTVDLAPRLRAFPIKDVKPYALMWAPVYVFMKRNEKFVSVKAPLDFFVPEELERLKSFTHFRIPEFVEGLAPFLQAGRNVREILNWKPGESARRGDVEYPEVRLPPAPYEISDAVLHLIGPLWGNGSGIEPFFVAALVDELCGALDGGRLVSARDQDVGQFERAVFTSAWAVFVALHLGYTEATFLKFLRECAFDRAAGFAGLEERKRVTGEASEIIQTAGELVGALGDLFEPVRADAFRSRGDRISRKMAARLERVVREFASPDSPQVSIVGNGGFIDG